MSTRVTFLLDNGSLAPAATLRLRVLAAELSARVGEPVAPVSLLHSSGVPSEQLEGVAAEILEPAVARRAAEGVRDFLIVPLFFGPSRALTDYLPERIAALRARWPDLRVRLGPALVQPGDLRLAQILADQIRAAGPAERVALVDHGSPVPDVTAVREALVRQLRAALGPGTEVVGCCMERRPGAEFDFNGPLLAELLEREGWNAARVTVAMQFLLPGRHAGPAGDVAAICRAAQQRFPRLQPVLTPLVGEHPRLAEILADRWQTALALDPA
jgi:sirohydrochlorin ferrochelatase